MTADKEKYIPILCLIASFVAGALLGWKGREAAPSYREENARTDTVVVRDTLRLPPPPPVEKEIVRFVPVTDTVIINDTIMVPILQKVYQTPDYKAWVSGYNAALDSIQLYPRTLTVTRTVSQRRWGVGLMGGYGAGLKGLTPFIGVGVYYRIW